MKATQGFIAWSGLSQIDGKPIVLIVTQLSPQKNRINRKTDAMAQTYILRSDMHPVEAMQTGADVSICGDCVHRPDASRLPLLVRSCYVAPRGPGVVYKAFARGSYPDLTNWKGMQALLLEGKALRMGSYGDPGTVPFEVWENLVQHTSHNTGYTHQWRTCDTRFSSLLMASADTRSQVDQANARGFRTFRVVAGEVRRNKRPDEMICPASAEAGRKLTCLSCPSKIACNGHRFSATKNTVIQAHGAGARNFIPLSLA